MVDLFGFRVMLGNSVLNLLEGDSVMEENPPLLLTPLAPPREALLPEEVYLRSSLSNSSSSKEGKAESAVDAEALGVVGVDFEEDPEELVDGVRRSREDSTPPSH